MQAWFLLTASFDVKRLLGDGGKKLDGLKSELGKYVFLLPFAISNFNVPQVTRH